MTYYLRSIISLYFIYSNCHASVCIAGKISVTFTAYFIAQTLYKTECYHTGWFY